jgi:hypothetical protein
MKYQQTRLPSNNISQQLFFANLPNCQSQKPEPCCLDELKLQSFYAGTPPMGAGGCTDIAFYNQAKLSQYYNYVSGNNRLL